VHAGEEDHARRGWTTSRREKDSPWKSQSKWQRREINRESRPTTMVWPTLGSRTATGQNRTEPRSSIGGAVTDRTVTTATTTATAAYACGWA